MAREGVSDKQLTVLRIADLRYTGQGYELEVPVSPAGEMIDSSTTLGVGLDNLIQRFHEMHLRHYEFANPAGTVELVNLRLSAIGHVPKAQLPAEPLTGTTDPSHVRKAQPAAGLLGRRVPRYTDL